MCKHKKTKTLRYQHSYFGDHDRIFYGESERCRSCGKIVKKTIQTPLGVKISNGTASVLIPYSKQALNQ